MKIDYNFEDDMLYIYLKECDGIINFCDISASISTIHSYDTGEFVGFSVSEPSENISENESVLRDYGFDIRIRDYLD